MKGDDEISVFAIYGRLKEGIEDSIFSQESGEVRVEEVFRALSWEEGTGISAE